MAIGLCAAAPAAYAADMPLGPADPAKIDRQLRPPPREWQTLEPQVTAPQQVVPLMPEGADDIHFTLHSLTIEGMSAYSDADVHPLYAPYIGQDISLATLFKIMAALQQKYLEDGYTLTKVFIPNQNIEGGEAKLLVVEGYVAEVEIDPAILPSPVIADARNRILSMSPLNMLALERIVMILNDLPDLNVSAVLAKIGQYDPSGIPSGAVRLILQKNPEDYSYGEASFDNYGSVFLGPYEFSLTGRLPHLGMNYGELTAMGVGTTSLQEQKYGLVHYEMPVLGASGTKVFLEASYAGTEPGDELDILDIQGRSRSISANISYPLIKQRDRTLTLDGTFELQNSKTNLLHEELYDDRERTITAGLNYGFADGYNGLNVLDVRYGKGLDILGVREAGSENLSRLDGHPDFDKFNLFAARLQSLPHNFGLYASVRGQYSAKPLLSSEEMSFGGRLTGRGYNPAEISGDKGISTSLELRWTNSFLPPGSDLQLQHYGFYDAGKVWNIDNNDTTGLSAASAGAGTRFFLGERWNGDINLAFPLTREPESPPPYAENFGPRLLFSIARKF
jgi:hemolysin activation/secretion protein